MANLPAIAPKVALNVPIVGAFLTSCGFSALITTRLGQRIEREHTWFVVMVGVFLTLGWLAVEDKKAATRSFAYFVCTGLPIIARALYLHSKIIDAIIDREIKDGKTT